MNDLDAGHVSSAVASILIEEIFGYHTINRSSSEGSQAAYRAVAGCPDPGDELSCAGTGTAGTIPTSWHIALDVREAFQPTTTLPALDFVDAGGMSYVGRRGHFVKSSVWNSTGNIQYVDLQFQNGSYMNHSFDSISSVDRFKLKQCTNTQLANTTMIRSYLDIVSDNSGVTLGSGGFIAFCPADGYFWLAPSCRSNSSQCIPYFFNSYHRAVDVLEVMQKAAVWNIPWAISVAYDEASFEDVLATSRSMFFRYTPDSPLVISPVEVKFPAHNSAGWANGNFSTASKDVSVRKLLSQDLVSLAPEVDAFVVAFDLTAAHVETLLADSEALGSFRSGACNWLNHWPEVWQPWIQSVMTTTTTTSSSSSSTSNSTSTTATPNLARNTTTPANAGTTQADSAASPDELVMGAVNPSVKASVLTSMAADRTAFVDIAFAGSQYDLNMEMIGIPTVGWAADQSATFPGVKELVVTPAELFLTPNPALIVAEGGSDASSAILPAEAGPGQNVTVSGIQYQVSDIIASVSLVELSSTSLSPLEVTGLGTPILIRMSTISPAAGTLCAYLDANNEWSQAGVYHPTAAEITAISGSQANTSGVWCATEHLSTFGILLAMNSEDAATECGFIETLTVDNEQCFSPAIFYSIVGVPLLCCCAGFICCYFKCRRPTKGKLKLQDQKGDAHEFEFQVGKAMTHAGGEDHGSDPAKAKIFVKWDVDIEQAKGTDYDYVKSRSGVNVTGTGLLLTTAAAQDAKSEKSNSPRSVRSRKLTEAEEEADKTFKEATNDVDHEDFAVDLVEEETDLPKRTISGIGYEAYGDNAHIEYFSATNNKWLQGCIQGTGSLVEDGKTMIPVYTIVLFGGAHKQVRDFVRTSLLRAPLKVHDPVSVQLGKTEDWRPGVVKSRQSFPLGYEVELLETHPVIDGNTTKVSPERIRPRFPDGLDVEVYRGVKLGWFPGVVKASNVDNTEAWPDVVVEMAPHWESDSKEDVTCPSCHVRASQRRPTVKSSAAHTLEQI